MSTYEGTIIHRIVHVRCISASVMGMGTFGPSWAGMTDEQVLCALGLNMGTDVS